MGAHKVKEKEESQVRVVSEKFIIHEDWNSSTLRNDIALIKLPSTMTMNGEF